MKKAVFFDLDGTLLNTVVDLGAAVDCVLREYHLQPCYTQEDYKHMVGNGAMRLLERAFAGLHRSLKAEEKEQALQRFKEIYSVILFDHTELYAGILPLLELLKQAGHRVAVITNKPEANARQMIDHYFPKGMFDFVAGQREGVPVKPDPALVFLAMEQLGLTASEVVYVGDSNTDIQTAKNAGVFSIGVAWGFRGAAELRGAGADAIACHPQEIEKIIRNLHKIP